MIQNLLSRLQLEVQIDMFETNKSYTTAESMNDEDRFKDQLHKFVITPYVDRLQ